MPRSARPVSRNRRDAATVEALEARVLLSTYYLSPRGNDAAAGTLAAPWKTLQTALDRTRGGDELILRGGAYGGGGIVTQPNITIRSFDGERATVTAPLDSPQQASAIEFRFVPGGRLLNLDISGGVYGVKANGEWGAGNGFASGLLIRRCTIHDTAADAVKITPGCDNVVIRGNEIYRTGLRDDNAQGIDNVNGDHMTVRDNYIHDIRSIGIFAKGGATGVVIERNRIVNCGQQGAALGFYTDAEFFDRANRAFYENIDGIIRNNVIAHTHDAGIGLYAALNPRVYNNTLVDVAQGDQAGIIVAPGTVGLTATTNAYAPVRDARVYNNLVSISRNGATAIQIRVIDGHTAVAGVFAIDNNLYFRPGGHVRFRDDRTPDLIEGGSLSQWQKDVGGDANSMVADPLLDGGDRPTADSPTIDAGTRVRTFAADLDGVARPQGAAWDIGASEFRSPVPPRDRTPPTASLAAAPRLRSPGGASYPFRVTYADDNQVDPATIDGRDLVVTGPGGFEQIPALAQLDPSPDGGKTRTATYHLAPPGGSWDPADNGVYTITVRPAATTDERGNPIPRTTLGAFSVKVPKTS